MGNWETYMNDSGEGVDPLVRIAAAHYQFEAIHPFADGNGRTGRILMVLSLINQKLLTYPILYISGYIKRNKPAYYRLLRDVSARGTWRTFIRYMLTGFYEQAKETKTTLMNVAALQEKMRERLRKRHPKIYTADLVEAMFAMPVLTPGTLGQRLDINYRTASRYLAELAAGGVLSEKYIGKYHLYANKALFALLKG
jgi:Fic family protein